MYLVSKKKDFEILKDKTNIQFIDIDSVCDAEQIFEKICNGDDMLFVSKEKIGLLMKFWIFAVDGKISGNATVDKTCPQNFPDCIFKNGEAGYLYFRAESSYAMHGIDEEPRAVVTPFIVNKDSYGNEKGAVGLWIKNYDSSLSGLNYKGGNWYIVAADSLDGIMTEKSANGIVDRMIDFRNNQTCYLSRFSTEFPIYRKGERIRIDYTVENREKHVQSAFVEISDKNGLIVKKEIAVNGLDTYRGHTYIYPDGNTDNMICCTLSTEDRFIYGEKRESELRFADRVSTEYMVSENNAVRPTVSVENGKIIIDGKECFFNGTHYYPCSDFFELSYRNINISKAKKTVFQMASAGLKICRIWCDPFLDEESLRGMESIVEILAKNGIIAWITFFSSWVHWMEVRTEKHQARFEAADMIDESLIGLILKDMGLQREFVAELGERFRDFSNIVWDFSNEFSVVNVPYDRASFDWIDSKIINKAEPYRSVELFKAWAKQINSELKRCGALQPVIYGVSCWDTGSDNYLCTKDADIIATHTYMDREAVRYYSALNDSTCIAKPFIIEEFGGTWESFETRAEEYHSRFCSYIGTGNTAAMSYEWGTSWLCDEISGIPPFLKFQNDNEYPAESKGFFYGGRYEYAKSWPNGCISACPWIASHIYGINYPNVNYETPTVRVTKRFSQIGQHIQFRRSNSGTYYVLPFEFNGFTPLLGYTRRTKEIFDGMRSLWEVGALYDVWQGDSLDHLPDDAKIVIYPCEISPDEKTDALLKKLSERGAKVYFGNDKSYLSDPDFLKTEFRGDVQLMRKKTSDGDLYVFHSEKEDAVRVEVGNYSLDILGDGLLITAGEKLIASDFCGSLSFKCRQIVNCNRRATVLMKDGKLVFLPFYPCTAEIFDFVRYSVSDNGRIVDTLPNSEKIEISEDDVTYTFIFEK